MSERAPFVPTHRLRDAIPELRLAAGTLLRQINPYAGDRFDHLMMLDEDDWNRRRQPWILTPADVEPLDCWPVERQKRMDAIAKRAGWGK